MERAGAADLHRQPLGRRVGHGLTVHPDHLDCGFPQALESIDRGAVESFVYAGKHVPKIITGLRLMHPHIGCVGLVNAARRTRYRLP